MKSLRPLCVACLLALLVFGAATPVAASVPLGGLAVAVSADGGKLVAGGGTRAIYDLDPATLAVKRRVYLGRSIVAMAFSKDAKRLWVESTDVVQVLDGDTLAVLKTIEKAERMSVASPAGLVAVRDTKRSTVRVFSMSDGSERATITPGRRTSLAAFGLSPDGKRLGILYYRKQDEAEKKVPYKEIPKDLKDAALNEFKQRHDGYTAHYQVIDVATGKPAFEKTIWFGAPGGGNRLYFHGDQVFVVSYQNQNVRIDAQGEATYFELGNSYNYGVGASADHGVFLTGGLRDGSRTSAGDLQGKAFRLDELPGFPEYFKSFSLAADGTGYAGTTGYRVIRIQPDGTIDKSAPVF